ncbi:aegerolysin type hemolysin [Trametes meyenii]|nr:aegerolysin type hemolysin [Trametes meyenii]
MGYAEWVAVEIVNGAIPIKLVKLFIEWGKLYEKGEPDSAARNERTAGLPTLGCGGNRQRGYRSVPKHGTMGRFSLVDARNGREIRHFYWDCPYSSSGNVWRITIKNKGFIVESQGENLKSGALGNITVEVVSNFAVPE